MKIVHSGTGPHRNFQFHEFFFSWNTGCTGSNITSIIFFLNFIFLYSDDNDDILNGADLFDNNSDAEDQDFKPPTDLLNENGLAKTMEAATAAFKQG